MSRVKIKSALAVSRAGDSLIGVHVTLRYMGRELLGEVIAIDGKGDKRRLAVKHFNGEPWPLEPLLEYDLVGVLLRDEERAQVWVVCDAPKGGCGGGRRKRILVAAGTEWCPHCGSQVRVCKVQPPISET